MYATEYSYWDWNMSTNYPNYKWQAHEVTSSDGYISTLFHLTGVKTDSSYTSERQPVLLVNGSLSNSLSWIFENPTEYTNSDVIDFFADYFFNGDPMAVVPRTDSEWYELAGYVKTMYPDVWTYLSTYDETVDLELMYQTSGLVASALSDEKADCIRLDMDEWWTSLQTAKFGDDSAGDAEFRLESALPIYLFDHGYDIWINGNRGTYFNRKHTKDTVDSSYNE